MSEHADLRIDAALDRVAEMLKADSVAAKDEESAEATRKSLVTLRSSRTDIRVGFSRELAQRLEFQTPCALRAKLSTGGKGLSLQSGEVIDEYVAASSLAHLIDSECLDQMMPMHQRMTKLLRQPTLRMVENPFSAPSIVSSLDAALSAIPDVTPDYRTQWMRRMTSLGGLGFHTLYAELNRILEDSGVDDLPAATLPPRANGVDAGVSGMRDELRRPTRSDTASTTVAPNGTSATDPLNLLANNLASLVSKLQRGVSNPAGAATPAWPALMSSNDGSLVGAALGFGPNGAPRTPVATSVDQRLMDSLSALQAANSAFDVAEISAPPRVHLREAVPGYASGEISVLDATTIELVSMLFEFVFERRELRDEVKGVLGRLQIPMLKAAMVDRGFFSRKDHPARLLLNRLADVGLGWSPDNPQEAPLFLKITDVVGEICRSFVDDLSVFSLAQQDLDQFVELQELDAQPLLDARAAEAAIADREIAAAREVKAVVDSRVAAHALPEQVSQFVQDSWRPHMCVELISHGRDSREFAEAVAALDDLIWSVQPKLAPQDRHDLGQRIPGLVRRLRAGVSTQSNAGAFFDQLFDVHLGLLRGAEPDYVELTDLVDDVEAPLEDSFHELVAQLQRGQWIEIESDSGGELRYSRLTWISPQRTSYLFTTRLGGKATIFSAIDLAESFRTDQIRLLASEPLIDRALGDMFKTA